jgi:hypothetical protein
MTSATDPPAYAMTGVPTLQSDTQRCVPYLRNVSEAHSQLAAQPEQFAFYLLFPGVLVRIIEIHRWIFEPDARFGFVAFATT